jgi:hypothetical protein
MRQFPRRFAAGRAATMQRDASQGRVARRWGTDEAEQERRWSAFAAARERAQATGRIEDGIAAGRAWGAFLNAFLPTGTRQRLGGAA